MFDLKAHLQESERITMQIDRKVRLYTKLAVLTKKLRLKRLNNHYCERGIALGLASLVLQLRNADMLSAMTKANMFEH